MPERPYFRSTLHEKRKEIISLQKKLLRQIVKCEMKSEEALGLLGEFMADAIKQKMVALKSPPNAPITILIKGSSNPLIDTGQTRNSITYAVNR